MSSQNPRRSGRSQAQRDNADAEDDIDHNAGAQNENNQRPTDPKSGHIHGNIATGIYAANEIVNERWINSATHSARGKTKKVLEYEIDWDGKNPDTGKKWENTWTRDYNCRTALIEAWDYKRAHLAAEKRSGAARKAAETRKANRAPQTAEAIKATKAGKATKVGETTAKASHSTAIATKGSNRKVGKQLPPRVTRGRAVILSDAEVEKEEEEEEEEEQEGEGSGDSDHDD